MSGARTDEVLIVGGGPTGLTMACELARHGIVARVIDRNDERSTRSKAMAVHARSLELWEQLGILDEALERGRKLHGANVYSQGKRIVHVGFDDIDCPHPFVLSLPQSESERLLEERLVSLSGKVERSTRLETLSQDDGEVRAALAHADGREELVRAKWLIGCDGAHSTVRALLDLPFEGARYDETFVLADVWLDWALPDDEVHVFFSPEGLLGAIPQPGEGRWRVVADVGERGKEGDPAPSLELVEGLLRRRTMVPMTIGQPRWLSAFSVHRRIVPSYRAGRVFLAGDAAHIHSPAGGQGMNTGMQDACNLSWKLAAVIKGEARDEILDSYSLERRPIAAATLQGTDLATRVVTLRSPITRELRDRIGAFLVNLEIVQKRLTHMAAELTLNYRRSPIVSEHRLPLVKHAVIADRRTEAPSMSDWLDFGAAPAPGDRAPDVVFDREPKARLFQLLTIKHTLLLFDGAAATGDGYRNLAAIAKSVRDRYARSIDVHVVLPHHHREPPKELEWDGSVLFDGQRALHRRYGAGSECLYLIRPDGYVGYRSQPAELAPLLAYLDRVFT